MKEEPQDCYIKNRRTGMYVARQPKAKSASHRMPVSGWKWVWELDQAERFERSMLMHPIMQMDIEKNAVCFDANGQQVDPWSAS